MQGKQLLKRIPIEPERFPDVLSVGEEAFSLSSRLGGFVVMAGAEAARCGRDFDDGSL